MDILALTSFKTDSEFDPDQIQICQIETFSFYNFVLKAFTIMTIATAKSDLGNKITRY